MSDDERTFAEDDMVGCIDPNNQDSYRNLGELYDDLEELRCEITDDVKPELVKKQLDYIITRLEAYLNE